MENLYFVNLDITKGNLYGYGGIDVIGEFFEEGVEYDVLPYYTSNLALFARGLTFISSRKLAELLLTGEALKAEILEISFTLELHKQNKSVLLATSEKKSSILSLSDFIALALGWLRISNRDTWVIQLSKEEDVYTFSSSNDEKIVISKQSPEYHHAELIISNYFEKKFLEKNLQSTISALHDMIKSYVENAE